MIKQAATTQAPITVPVPVTRDRLRDELITFYEQAQGPLFGQHARKAGTPTSVTWADALLSGETVTVREYLDGGEFLDCKLTFPGLLRGLGLLAEADPKAFGRILSGASDCLDADAMIQAAMRAEGGSKLDRRTIEAATVKLYQFGIDAEPLFDGRVAIYDDASRTFFAVPPGDALDLLSRLEDCNAAGKPTTGLYHAWCEDCVEAEALTAPEG